MSAKSKKESNIEREPFESDRPIEEFEQDRFGRWEFSRRVAQIIGGRRDSSSIVIGIYAPWGEGKTSVLNMIIQELNTHSQIQTIRFNPWRFQGESHLLNNFFSVLAGKLGKSIVTRGEKLSKFFRDYADVLAPLSYTGVDVKGAIKGLVSARPEADLEKLKGRIEKFLKEADHRIVVVMDDIDRLDKEEIQSVFKLVKLSADFPNMAYVLAFDEERVAQALEEKYGSIEAGQNYIEKIVQVPLHLPSITEEALRLFTFEGIDAALKSADIELSQQQVEHFVNTFALSFQPRLDTPRLAKRYTNALSFVLPLLKNEVDLVDLMIIEAARIFYPHLYSTIRDNPDIFLGKIQDKRGKDAIERTKAILDQALNDLSEDDKRVAKHIIWELFPRMRGPNLLGGAIQGPDWQSTWTKGKRITAIGYFDRYFSFGVPPNDVSDQRIDELIEQVAVRNIDYIVNKISSLASSQRASVFISKLRIREKEIDPEAASKLALGIALNGELFPDDGGVFSDFGASTLSQACILIRQLIERLDTEIKRDTTALEIANQVTPLTFAAGYARWIGNLKLPNADPRPDDIVISNDCEVEVKRRIVQRIADEAEKDLLTRKFQQDAIKLYRLWFLTDAEALHAHLADRFERSPEEAGEFLRSFRRKALNLESGISFEMDLDKDNYNFIVRMVDPEVIMAALRKVYKGIDTPEETYPNKKKVTLEERSAVAFSILHKQAQQEGEKENVSEVIAEQDVSEDAP